MANHKKSGQITDLGQRNGRLPVRQAEPRPRQPRAVTPVTWWQRIPIGVRVVGSVVVLTVMNAVLVTVFWLAYPYIYRAMAWADAAVTNNMVDRIEGRRW